MTKTFHANRLRGKIDFAIITVREDEFEALIAKLFQKHPNLLQGREGIRLIAHVSWLLPTDYLEELLKTLRGVERFYDRQAYGELVTLVAFRDEAHAWAVATLDNELAAAEDKERYDEWIAVGMASAASHLWDDTQARAAASRVLCRLIPKASDRVAQAIATVFWAREDFSLDGPTKALLLCLAEHPHILTKMDVAALAEHIVGLLPHERELVLNVCNAILATGRQENNLFEAGPHLVKIAMTLQRFPDTRERGLTLLESLLRLGLDDAFRVLRDIDIRPTTTPTRQPPQRRRRRRR